MSNQLTQAGEMSIKGYLMDEQFQKEVAQALPSHCDMQRFIRAGRTALQRVPKLNQCSPASFLKGFLDAAQWGLEINGHHAHLIPYGREATLIIDYKGIVELAYRTGKVDKIHCDVVFEGDLFVYDLGEVKSHVKWGLRGADKPESRGDVIGAYAHIVLKGGVCKGEFMDLVELDAIRRRSKAANNGPWVTDTYEMYKKTVFRRASKWIPLAAEVFELYSVDRDSLILESTGTSRPVVGKSVAALTQDLTQPEITYVVEDDEPDDAVIKADFEIVEDSDDPTDQLIASVMSEDREEIDAQLAESKNAKDLKTTVKVLVDYFAKKNADSDLDYAEYIHWKASQISF